MAKLASFALLALVAFAAAFAPCKAQDIPEDLSIVVDLISAANLTDAVLGASNITVLAPLNSAFEGLTAPEGDALIYILSSHVVPTPILSSEVPEGDTELETLSGATLTVSNVAGNITITSSGGVTANVVTPDIVLGDNVVVHTIDAVLLPESEE